MRGAEFPETTLAGVDMSQGQIVISSGHQQIHPGRCIGAVVGAAAEAGVEHADIETAPHRSGIAWYQVFSHRPVRKAASMDRHTQFGQLAGMRGAGTEDMDVGLLGQLSRDDTFRIVIAPNHKNGNAVRIQAGELLVDKKTCAEIAPVTVVEIRPPESPY